MGTKQDGSWIKFLGTAGARFVMIKQLRASGGLWLRSKDVNILIDPGPGSLVRCASSKPRLDPATLDAIILTHRHLDHCADVNVMIEAMTEGGFKKRGLIFAPQDALDVDPVVLQYARRFVNRVETLEEKTTYQVGSFSFETSPRHIHSCQTYGLKFTINNVSVSLLTDTGYMPELESFYDTDVLIVNVVFLEPKPGVAHLSLVDVSKILEKIKPKKVVLTHFGMSMVRAKPHVLAQRLSWETGLNVVAASDGMSISF